MVWLLAFASPFVVAQHALIINEIAIVALFALSLDLILGYTGIVSLGHAAFLGFGAYSAALFAKHVMPDPLVGLAVGIAAATALGAVCSLTIMRGTDLTRLMVTLGMALLLLELANKLDWLTGGSDGLQGVTLGPLLGRFEFDLMGQTAAWYSLTVLLVLFVLARRLVHSPFGATLKAVRDNRLRAMAIGIPVSARLAVAYTVAAGVAGAAGALAGADHGVCLARCVRAGALGRCDADPRHRRRRLALWRHRRGGGVQAHARCDLGHHAPVLDLLDRPVPGGAGAGGP